MRLMAELLGSACLAIVVGVLTGSGLIALLTYLGLILCLEAIRP